MKQIRSDNPDPATNRSHGTIAYARNQAQRALSADRIASTLDIPPHAIPGYEMSDKIQHGGQGVVYRAIQTSTSRTVAIKILRQRFQTSQAEQFRFKREVEILSQLRHPNIVRLTDGGATNDFLYFVMDHIDGQPLDIHISNSHLALDLRLKMFIKICRAISAAHMRGVIHRDIKPSNILVNSNGEPHVLDFGLAKLIPGELETTAPDRAVTVTGQFVGSLPWATPEQAEGAHDKIDVRTDVYALGLVLFHMLTNEHPYNVAGNMHSVLGNILETEPLIPNSMNWQISPELDTIILKCLEKSPGRRYQSAGQLADDIERHLAGEPIDAKRDNTLYLLSKTVRRHRTLLATACVILLSVIGYAVTATILLQRATTAEQRAEQSASMAREKFRQAHQVAQMLVGEVSDRLANLSGAGETRRVILEHAYDQLVRLTDEGGDDPELWQDLAKAHHGLGDIAQSLGRLDHAESHLLEALAIRRELADADPDDLNRQADLSIAHVRVGDIAKRRNNDNDAGQSYGQALDIDERLAGLEPDNLCFLDNLLWSYDRLGELAQRRMATGIASDFFAKQQSIAESLLEADPENPDRIKGLRAVYAHKIKINALLDKQAEVVAFGTETIKLTEKLVELQPDNRDHLTNLAANYLTIAVPLCTLNQIEESFQSCADAKAIIDRLLEDDPDVTLNHALLERYHSAMAILEKEQADAEASAKHARIALASIERSISKFPNDAQLKIKLMETLSYLGRNYEPAIAGSEAHEYTERAIALAGELTASPDALPRTLILHAGILHAATFEDLQDTDQAIVLCERAVKIAPYPDPMAMRYLAMLYQVAGRSDDAIDLLTQVLALPNFENSPRRRSIVDMLAEFRQ